MASAKPPIINNRLRSYFSLRDKSQPNLQLAADAISASAMRVRQRSLLPDGAGYLRKYIVRVAADQFDGTDYDHKITASITAYSAMS